MSGLGFRIQNLWAYLAVHADDDEGVIAVLNGDIWTPAIGADMNRIRSLEPQVKKIAAVSGMSVVLAQFGQRTDLERIE